jgi:hypothetical protein
MNSNQADLNQVKVELDQFAAELERFTLSRRFAVLVLIAVLVTIYKATGLNKFLVAVAGLLGLVLALPKINDWLDQAIPALDKKLNG